MKSYERIANGCVSPSSCTGRPLGVSDFLPESNPTFEALSLPPAIVNRVHEMGFVRPTPVQVAAIPEVLKGDDLMVQAKTGSGKTLGFGLPLLAMLDPDCPDTQVLVIVPTRELAIQVAAEIGKMASAIGVMVSAIYGGTKMDKQLTDLAWSAIIVGTPGRLRDHMGRGNLRLSRCSTVVLDEADEMLDMGFRDDILFLMSCLPTPRHTLLFSATFAPPIEDLARRILKNPRKIAVSSGLVTPSDITHRVVRVSEDRRVEALASLIEREHPRLGIVFCRRKSETAQVSRRLRQLGVRSGYLNGDMDQSQREATMAQFRKGEILILVATDVAARGLDISEITHVFNFSVPWDTETYVHRSGRTGRAGRKGVCITLVTPPEERDFSRIQRDLSETLQAQAASAQAVTNASPVVTAGTRVPSPVVVPAEVSPSSNSRGGTKRQDTRTSAAPRGPSRHEGPQERSGDRDATRDSRKRAPVVPTMPTWDIDSEALQQAARSAEAHAQLAKALLEAAPAERVVQALLARTGGELPWVRKQEASESSERRRERDHSVHFRRVTRKPSRIVYGD
jgi:ATP-dependent RNA helicase DeaD